MTLLEQCSPQGTLDLFAPQAVDQQVQHVVEKIIKQERIFCCSSGWRDLGVMYMTMAVPKKSPTTQRWEEQVEKAFLRPSADWILRMANRMRA